MAEIVLDLNEEELALVEELAEQNGVSVDKAAQAIFINRLKSDVAEITPTTALMNQFKSR